MAEFVHPVRVEWSDSDPAGILFYGNLFRWIDAAAHRLFREIGVARDRLLVPELLGYSVLEVGAQFLAPADYFDALEVRCHVTELRAKTFRVDYRIVRPAPDGSATLLATAYEWRCHVARGPDGVIRSLAIPPDQRAALECFRPEAPADE